MTTTNDKNAATRFFGPLTPFATVIAMALAAAAVGYLWALGIVLNVVLIFVGVILLLGRGKVRQIGTGITIAYLTFTVIFALIIFVDFLRTN